MSDSLNRFLRDERRRRLKEAGIKPKKFDSRLPMKQPKRIELTYKAALQRYQIETDKEERDRILVLLPFLLTPAKAEETSGFFGDLKLEISAILLSQLPKIITETGKSTLAFNSKTFDNPLYNIFGFNTALTSNELDVLLNSWVHENVALIRNVNEKQIGQLETSILSAVRSGKNGSELADDMVKIFGAGKRNVQFIAEDQITKLDSQVTMAKMSALGIDSYFWRTMEDDRVRPAHAARNNQLFYLNDPPPDGHAGLPPNCRCRQEPNLKSIL